MTLIILVTVNVAMLVALYYIGKNNAEQAHVDQIRKFRVDGVYWMSCRHTAWWGIYYTYLTWPDEDPEEEEN